MQNLAKRYKLCKMRVMAKSLSEFIANELRYTRCLFFLVFIGCFASIGLSATPVTVKLGEGNSGVPIPAEFSGLSFEVERLIPDPNGLHYFRATNEPLVALFKTLGVANLRLGGSTADRPVAWKVTHADLDQLFAFAKAAGVKVSFTLRMRESNSKDPALLAKYIIDRHSSALANLGIGNEPDTYTFRYPELRDLWRSFSKTIVEYSPTAKFCGPGLTQGKVDWSGQFAADFKETDRLAEVTVHYYPGGDGRKVGDLAVSRREILSAEWTAKYERYRDRFLPAVKQQGVPFRIAEMNNFYNGGAPGVSDSFASALWALDSLHWWALQGASGINFHTGDTVATAAGIAPCHYAAFWSTEKGYIARPLSYGIKAFQLGGRGKTIPVSLTSAGKPPNLTAYAVAGDDQATYVTLIHKEHGAKTGPATVVIDADASFKHARAMVLAAKSGNVAAADGISVGGSEIRGDGSWEGTWSKLPLPGKGKKFTVTIPPATAMIIELTK